ncbi:MAG TPA: D-cysteine desulfhydrase family protein [Anaerolineae bacterium]
MKLDSLPRYRLTALPTPLDETPRLSKELGARILFKRDDLTGFALGGNKIRKLEFLLADALAKNADVLVTGGGAQSNHTRATAAAARKAGLDAFLVLSGERPSESNGNLLLEELLGAEIRFLGGGWRDTDSEIGNAAAELAARGRRPYIVPVGGSSVLGCCSYIIAVGELLEQLDALQVNPDYIVVTTGSCGTHAGILAGLKYHGRKIPVIGITVSRSVAEGTQRITRLVNETAAFLETPLPLEANDIVIREGYVGKGYAQITPEAREAIKRVARSEGIFLDQVYTGKTMAGMIDLLAKGDLAHGATIVFWHTGGTPGLFGHAQDFREM